jgi:hypothetical protein
VIGRGSITQYRVEAEAPLQEIQWTSLPKFKAAQVLSPPPKASPFRDGRRTCGFGAFSGQRRGRALIRHLALYILRTESKDMENATLQHHQDKAARLASELEDAARRAASSCPAWAIDGATRN